MRGFIHFDRREYLGDLNALGSSKYRTPNPRTTVTRYMTIIMRTLAQIVLILVNNNGASPEFMDCNVRQIIPLFQCFAPRFELNISQIARMPFTG